jgi:hypothetical protein
MENEVVITDENNIVVENDDVVIEPVAEAPVLNTEPEVVIEEPVVENDVATDATLVTEEPAIAETEVVEEPSVKENNGDDAVVEPEVENTLVNSDAQVVEPQENFEAKYTALCVEYAKLQNEILALQEQNQILVAFKAKVDDAEKDAMIAKFYYLSDEEKKDVIENKANYTVEEIESKLSVICVRNKVNFDLDNNDKNDINIEDVVTYTLDDNTSSVPAWITAVKNNSKK